MIGRKWTTTINGVSTVPLNMYGYFMFNHYEKFFHPGKINPFTNIKGQIFWPMMRQNKKEIL